MRLALVTDDIRWMSVDGAGISVETGNADELRKAMVEYFEARASSHSQLLDIHSSGPFVTTLEQAGSRDRPGECAIAVYEFSGQLIRNVWYYRAHACEETPAD